MGVKGPEYGCPDPSFSASDRPEVDLGHEGEGIVYSEPGDRMSPEDEAAYIKRHRMLAKKYDGPGGP